MTVHHRGWGNIHPSAYQDTARLLRWAPTTLRAHGALRYCCPVTGSFVLVTDEPTLACLVRPQARIRCLVCGETHLLTQDDRAGDPAVIVAKPAKP